MTDTITKKTLAERIYKEIGLSYAESVNLVDAIFSNLAQGLKEDEIVKIPLFGTFNILHKKAREGRNPRTKETKVIPPRNTVSFSASTALKDEVNK